ncbi:GGDEF domain-containing protein [Nocardioides seonyuensis]|uniref:GGDEF domain-containing protein n=1 Tax=Nocardioides seonyuensis TaxID=2518371 RepID=A0A4P7IHQ0_9ACTN|nr:GGDEF domain-containing protein [Nocardioides seonyuensis]QBX55331.1 GGDEF domain-containing protein [Nocardioides seonyuensis]
MLDNTSLRAALALLMCTLLVLFYFITYRTSRSAFAGWWCVTLATLMGGSLAYLTVDSAHARWTIPLGHASNLVGVGCIWAAGRSLRFRHTPLWWLAVAPVVVAPLAALDNPGHTIMPAGEIFLLALGLMLIGAAVEMGFAARAVLAGGTADIVAYRRSLWSLVAASAMAGGFYFARWVAYVLVGPDQAPYSTVFGNESTSVVLIVVMTTVAFSMSTLSDEQHKLELRDLAARDGLTGLLNRTGFLRLADEHLARHDGEESQVIMADLDHFKAINDEHGHAAGDHAIITFAAVCTASVRVTDLVGRYGGEEFILLLSGASLERASDVTESIRTEMAKLASVEGAVLPTVSFGVCSVDGSLETAIERADAALYKAKEAGRNRTVHHAEV